MSENEPKKPMQSLAKPIYNILIVAVISSVIAFFINPILSYSSNIFLTITGALSKSLQDSIFLNASTSDPIYTPIFVNLFASIV
jgi:hypothetical protein